MVSELLALSTQLYGRRASVDQSPVRFARRRSVSAPRDGDTSGGGTRTLGPDPCRAFGEAEGALRLPDGFTPTIGPCQWSVWTIPEAIR